MAVGLLASACAPASHTPTSSAGTAAAATPTLAVRQTAQVIGAAGTYPTYTVTVPSDWSNLGNFVIKYASNSDGRVVGLSVWDVGLVYHDPCRWQGQGFDPGPSVDDLVAALVAQKMRNATTPTDVTLAGYSGKYFEWSVPADLKMSTLGEFDACDVTPDGDHNFNSWLVGTDGYRYEQVPGQVDRLWVLDVNGQRLVVDATYSPNTSDADRTQLNRAVSSLQFGAH